MKIIENIPDRGAIPAGSVLSIGNFDGIHAGHQQIIARVKSLAGKFNASSVIMTFDPHPVAILHPHRTLGVLTPLEFKQYIIRQLGIDYMIVIKDSFKLLNMSPSAFIDDFLVNTINPASVVEGDNFNFGYGRSGNSQTLRDMGRQRGFGVEILEPLKVDIKSQSNVICSSSLIRQLLETGQVADAAILLTRPYKLIGKTVKGRGKGRELGFPTANIDSENQIVPDEGVYAGFVYVADDFHSAIDAHEKIPAAFSIGRAKTFLTDNPLLVEAHLLVENPGDLYGKYLAMDFIDKIRNQQRFGSEKELSVQIKKDCDSALNILSNFKG
jgi:riboflavin kinase/FMN adenylyltransferase